MKALIQRVRYARVEVDQHLIGQIDQGILVFLGVEQQDSKETVTKMSQKLLNYRIFSDSQGKMNLSLTDIGGGLLLVSQFTLAADTQSGLRPSFSKAAAPALAEELYELMLHELRRSHQGQLASGQFAADMQISLQNDGPVTFLLQC